MQIVGEVLLLAPALKLKPCLSTNFSVYLNILSWGLLALTLVALRYQIFTFCLYLLLMSSKNHWGHVGKLEMGILGPQRPAMSRQHSFTYCMLCDHQRGALTNGHRDQTDSSEFYGNFSSAVGYQSFCCRQHAGSTLCGQTILSRASDKLVYCGWLATWTSGCSCDACIYYKSTFWPFQNQRTWFFLLCIHTFKPVEGSDM